MGRRGRVREGGVSAGAGAGGRRRRAGRDGAQGDTARQSRVVRRGSVGVGGVAVRREGDGGDGEGASSRACSTA